ncbi:glycosyltransferase family 4 protein [Oxalicibacterium faecigallinarum]|uniref:Glycosyltransferase WbuB n=1 Tax=Oxalicibacterium faecigallinarum TaxID=573741 RepID=A0A8J3F208_9BURK|nr:glycosyltransferase family 4 protein [Oxalicibacterium faecigallinarum]GGI17902.1 glycosyltransferase WbuB [Oxalicibacterium faecigallinarum]
MRILVVSQYFWPENFRVNDMAAELVRRGHQVTVLTGLPNYPDGVVFPQFRADPSVHARFEGVEIVRVPMTARGAGSARLVLNYLSFAASASTIGWWKLRGQAFDVIFAFEPSPITVGIPAAVMRFAKKAPLAFWVLDLWPGTLKAIGVVHSPFLLKIVGWLVSFIYRRCDLILAQSRSFVSDIRSYAGQNAWIEYFPSWADSIAASSDVVPAPEISRSPGQFNVMFAGNIGDAQDFPAILQAAQRLKDARHIQWLIVGDGRMAQWVTNEIKRVGLQDTVKMLGRHPLERMPSFFEHADALLVSLKDEPIFAMTIPGKLQSYLAAGIPVLAMLDGEGADLVRSANAGLTCAAGDANGLAAAVLQLSTASADERLEMGNNAFALAAREFDRGTLMNRFEAWLKKLSSLRKPVRQPENT